MKAMRIAAAVASLLVLGTSQIVDASTEGEPLGQIYLSASQSGYEPNLGKNGPVPPFETFEFYVIVEIDYADIGRPTLNDQSGIFRWEASVDIPGEVTVLSRISYPPNSFDLHWGDDNWITGLGMQIEASLTPFVLVTYSAMLLADQTDLELSLGPSMPSRFEPSSPGWSEGTDLGECSEPDGTPVECWRRFELACPMTINCSWTCLDGCPSWGDVGSEQRSWGSWKGLYRN